MIKRYKLKDGLTHEFLIENGCKEGGRFVHPDGIFHIYRNLVDSIELDIAFPADLSEWNDYDYILVLDDDFGQPYTPFYNYYARMRITGAKPGPYVRKVVTAYNKIMDSLPFFEELPPKKLADFLT